MGDFGKAIQKRMETLHSVGADLDKLIRKHQSTAGKEAVKVATELTPPTNESNIGTNTVTGDAKSHWETDSVTESVVSNNNYTVTLANNVHYISYLNDGHRMDKHFVPGLIVNPYTGQLEKVDPEVGGIMVGTKTPYVPGLFMKDAAINAYKDALLNGLNSEIKELFKK